MKRKNIFGKSNLVTLFNPSLALTMFGLLKMIPQYHKPQMPSSGLFINPLLPTGQFIGPKLIILIKCLIDIIVISWFNFIFKVLFQWFWCSCELA